MQAQLQHGSHNAFDLLIANLNQEETRIRSTESLLNDLSQLTYDEGQIRIRIETARQLAAALQKDREVVLRQLSALFDVPMPELNLTALLNLCPEPLQQRLLDARGRLTKSLRRARGVASCAAILVGESLQMQQSILSSLMGISTSDRYDAYGAQPIDSCSTRMESRS